MTFPITINLSATALGTSACSLRFQRTVIDGYKEVAQPSRVVYGIAGHKFLDVYLKTKGDIRQAVVALKESFNVPKVEDSKSQYLCDEKHLLRTCYNVLDYIEKESSFDILLLNGQPATEQTFKILYYQDPYIIVYLNGTLDKLGKFRGGCFAIGDWKFTSSWDKKKYFKQFEMSRPLRVYNLGVKLMHEREPDSTLGKLGATTIGGFIDAVFVKADSNETSVERSEIFQYKDEEILQFRQNLNRYIAELWEELGLIHSEKMEYSMVRVKVSGDSVLSGMFV